MFLLVTATAIVAIGGVGDGGGRDSSSDGVVDIVSFVSFSLAGSLYDFFVYRIFQWDSVDNRVSE